MQRRRLTAGRVWTAGLAALLMAGCSAAPGASGPAETPTGPGTTSPAAPSPSPSGSPTSPEPSNPSKPGRPASNVPMTKLKPGEKPPQFVIFSFDGAGSHTRWQQFRAAAKPTDSRFVGFLSGIYLLTNQNRTKYVGPGHAPGKASIGFGGSKADVVTLIKDLNHAVAAGDEIGTHYNGHFCSGSGHAGNSWSTADWNSELGQFMKFLTDYKKLNGWGDEVPDLNVTPKDIKGGRTPCLEGKLAAMAPAWKKYGMTYDSSLSLSGGISWPVKVRGIWEFQMPYVYSPGFKRSVMAMDYNMWVTFNGGRNQPGRAPELRQKVRKTYDYMYQQAYRGNRAPVLVANHFNSWNGNAFNPAAMDFMKSTCGKPDTYCTTYQDVIAWMQLQDPAVLKALQAKKPVATGGS